MAKGKFNNYTFNTVKHSGDPKSVKLESGHEVEKQDYVFFKDAEGNYQKLKCADYHGSHFVYIDPLYNDPKGIGHWFAMCTCGSQAVMVGPKDANLEDTDLSERLLVCYIYHSTLIKNGTGQHQGGDGRSWQ